MDLRYETIKSRLSTLTKPEIQRILDNIDQVCFDEFNYDEANNKYCPLAMGLKSILAPTNELIQHEIGKRFFPVNIIKGVSGTFYTTDRKTDLLNLCNSLLES